MAVKPTSLNNLQGCSICLGEYEDPRKLPCDHTFCCKCLDQHIRTSTGGGQFFCPTCHHRCKVPAQGATVFPKNVILNSSKEFKQHQAATGMTSSKTPSKCDQHSNLIVDMYCDTCRTPVCIKCFLLKHKQHAYREIAEASKESKSLLSKLTDTAKKIANRLDDSLKQLSMSELNINRDCDEACREVSKNAENIRSFVTKREKSLVQEIREAQGRALSQLNSAYKEAEISKAAVDSLLSNIQDLLESEDAVNQVVQAPGLQEQLRQHETAPLQSVTLEVSLEDKVQCLSALNSMLGPVSVNETKHSQGSIGDTFEEGTKASLGSPLLDLKPDVDLISGLAIIDDCIFVTGYEQPYLWIHNTKTNQHRRHIIEDLEATGMAGSCDKILVVTENKRLHLIQTDQQMNIKTHVIKSIPFEPFDMSVDPVSGKQIHANDADKEVVVCDSQGETENRVKVKTRMTTLSSALATRDGYIVLDGAQEGKLHWVSRDGVVTHTYGESLCYPWHIVRDNQGCVIIADTDNDLVHLVGVNKELSHYLLTGTDGIRSPTCLCLDEANARLFVGCKDMNDTPTVRMYRWPFASGDGATGTHHKLRVQLTRYQNRLP